MASGTVVAALWIPRLWLLNLSTFDPWPRPVAVAALAGLLTGLSRRDGVRRAAVAGAGAATLALLFAYAGVRLSVPVLWIDRSPVRVVSADAARLTAYALVPGALGGAAGRRIRSGFGALRNRRASGKPPIRRL